MKNYNFKDIKNGTKKAEWVKDNAISGGYEHLSDCYGRYSHYKVNAFNYCEEMCKSLGGKNLHISSYNSQCFTVAFYTDNAYYLITRDYNYRVIING